VLLLAALASGRAASAVAGFNHADYPSLSPSGLIQEGRGNGRAMTASELDDVKASYTRAAETAKRLGADGIELHAAHGYLMDQFLWAETNVRDDGYGGAALADRARFPLEVVAAMRAATGPRFPISLRFSQFKEADYGARVFRTPEELSDFMALAKVAGVTMLNVSSRRFAKPEWPELHATRSIAGWTRLVSGLPVMTTGSVGLDKDMFADLFDGADPALRLAVDLAELKGRFLAGEFDLVGVGRMQIANPDFVAKLASGRLDALRLYRKAVDLGHLFGRLEPGLIEEGRKITAD
jgi:2,4-dienoyl-CoA reductase-like NADH-dependent reductase (Old Yellow Enzyme family)